MTPPVGGKSTAIEPGLIARATSAARYLMTGQAPAAWFGAGTPLAPVAQEVAGRAFDYPVALNTQTQPRGYENISFRQLRGLADSSDVVRLCIETRKDQMEKLEWTIRRREDGTDDETTKALMEALRFPDLENEWSTWLRLLLEDLLVIDAPTIYPWKTESGGHYALDVVDGATIKRVLDDRGRTPRPPAAAYQQILKGVPAADFTRTELIYLPRNPRPSRVYGMSPVEQIILTVNTAIRRALHQLDYYTEGNIPDAFASVPNDWAPPQIKLFQDQFDALVNGPQNSAVRRKIKFLPFGVTYVPTHTQKLFDEGDEWLARVICYSFSLPPNAFVKQQNRATAVSANEVALEEGLAPLMKWVKRMMDRVIAGPLGQPGYEFQWEEFKDLDGLTQAQIDQIYLDKGVLQVNEVRERLNMEPLTAEELAAAKPAPPVVAGATADPDAPQPPNPPAPVKVAKAGRGRPSGRSVHRTY